MRMEGMESDILRAFPDRSIYGCGRVRRKVGIRP
jgi:hypothetical protein